MNTFAGLVLYMVIGGILAGVAYNDVYEECYEYQENKDYYSSDLIKKAIAIGALWPLYITFEIIIDSETLESCKSTQEEYKQ